MPKGLIAITQKFAYPRSEQFLGLPAEWQRIHHTWEQQGIRVIKRRNPQIDATVQSTFRADERGKNSPERPARGGLDQLQRRNLRLTQRNSKSYPIFLGNPGLLLPLQAVHIR